MSFDRKQFVEDLRALVKQGVKFRHQGQDPATGLDCVNFPRWGYRKQGLELPPELDREFQSYTESPDGWRLIEIMRKWFQELDPVKAEPGDLFIIYSRSNPCHLAVKVTDTLNVEAYRFANEGKLVEQPLDPRRRIATAFRIPDF